MNLTRTQWAAVRRSLKAGRKVTASEFIEALQDIDELFADLEAANSAAIERADRIREMQTEARQ